MSALVKENETDLWNHVKAQVLLLKYLNKASATIAFFFKKKGSLQGFQKQTKTLPTLNTPAFS